MTVYRYRAARPDGAIVRGAVDAASAPQAAATVTDLGLYPITLDCVEPGDTPRRRVDRRDLAIVFQSIAALVSAGVPLERAVGASEALAGGALRHALGLARSGLREGLSFAHALAQERGVVPEVVLGMIGAGERGNQLAPALDQIAAHLEREAELVARVRQALAYPLLLVAVGTVSVLVIGLVIVPRFADVLGDLGEDIPLATRLLLTGSALLSHFWFLLIPLTIGAVWGVGDLLARSASRQFVDETLIAVPVLGRVRHALATARVTRALGGMLRAGMPLLPALEAARAAAGDTAVASRLERVRERVAQGTPLATALDREAAFTASARQLVAVGESSGRLGDMTLRAGDIAAQEADRGLKTLLTFVEPALIVAFGGLVAFVAAALLQAVYAIRPGGS